MEKEQFVNKLIIKIMEFIKKTCLLLLSQLVFYTYGQNLKINGLEIAREDLKKSNNPNQDYGDRFTFNEVQRYLSNNKEWRLPTVDELLLMFQKRNSIGNMQGDLYLCYGLNNDAQMPDEYSNKSWYKNPQNQSFWINFYKSGSNLDVDMGNQCYVRLVKVNSNYSVAKTNKTSEKPITRENNSKKDNNSNERITTYSGAYGFFGYNLDAHDIQFQLECSAPFNAKRLSSGMKWRYLLGNYKGLNVEGFGRIYFGKESKMYSYNDRWYLQLKAGYGLLKPLDDSFTLNYGFREKSKFVPVLGSGLGYKFLIKERITFDFLIGYHFQSTPKFNSSNQEYSDYQINKWKENIACPIEVQWGIGFQLD